MHESRAEATGLTEPTWPCTGTYSSYSSALAEPTRLGSTGALCQMVPPHGAEHALPLAADGFILGEAGRDFSIVTQTRQHHRKKISSFDDFYRRARVLFDRFFFDFGAEPPFFPPVS